jgi:NADH dehydrogenase
MFSTPHLRDSELPPNGIPPSSDEISSKKTTELSPWHTIVIVGGGAGGLELATMLGNRFEKSKRAHIILVDRSATHLWKPLLHEVAAGSMDANANQLEYIAQARWHHFEFQQGALIGLDRNSKTITVEAVKDIDGLEILPQRQIRYDTLVLSIGSITNFFNTPGAEEHALAVDSVNEAEQFRRRLIAACMRAQHHLGQAADHERPQVNIVIIGAGATGVELSAELRNTAQVLGAYGLHRLDPRKDIRITIVEAAPRILSALPEHISLETMRMLKGLNIDVLVDEKVSEVQKDAVLTASGIHLPADLTVWAAGIKVHPILANLGLQVNKLGQVIVNQSLQTEIDPSIFAFGDCASCDWPGHHTSVPPRAQAAHQEAKYLYHALQRLLDDKPVQPFVYHDRGSLISLGRFNAVGNLMGKLVGQSMKIEGTLARLLYFSLYRTHLVALHGVMRMLFDTMAQWLRRKTVPRVKLH